jgi:tyrosinase
VIPDPVDPPEPMRVRKDILTLSAQELQTYREKLDGVLQVGSLTDPGGNRTKWQELGFLHAEWCLHYQEATFLWHCAYLRYVEELIDFPIPYWNGYAEATSDIESP